MHSTWIRSVVVSILGLAAGATSVSAQPLGAFYWQLAPFCNVVALHITQQVTPSGAVYALTGFDDQCGGQERATAAGTATFSPDGTLAVGLTVVTPGGTPLHTDRADRPRLAEWAVGGQRRQPRHVRVALGAACGTATGPREGPGAAAGPSQRH